MNAAYLVNGRTGVAAAALLAAVSLGLTGAQTPLMAAPSGMSEIAKLAAAGGVDALQQELDARSPGMRAPGALTQTKPARPESLTEFFRPKERVLSKERTRPVTGNSPGPIVAGGDLFTPGPGIVDMPTGAAILPETDVVEAAHQPLPVVGGSYPLPGGFTPAVIIGGGGGGSGGGGGGGGTGGGGGGGSGGGSGGGGTPVVTAVPEPATWFTMLIGFFAIGFGLRHAAPGQSSRRLHGRVRFQ